MAFDLWHYYRVAMGLLVTFNFVLFWALPIFLQGFMWEKLLVRIFRPIYRVVDESKACRDFATKWIFAKPIHADFFATMVFVVPSIVISVGTMFYTQYTTGGIPYWMIAIYYFAWVGFGGRTMGAAYTFAHKEGHQKIYQPWIRATVGNLFENVLGVFWGNVPYNFSTSHIFIHHRLDAHMGDTFYQWDLKRGSWLNLAIFDYRILLHMIGFSSLRHFYVNTHMPSFDGQFKLLLRGVFIYWVVWPTIMFGLLRCDLKFFFFIYMQPLLGMTYFIALMNFGFHAFLEYDEEGQPVKCVNNTCIIEGEHDYFGEDDHMAHHAIPTIHHTLLPALHVKETPEWKHRHASVFRKISIYELSALVMLSQWEVLADHFVDLTGTLSKAEIVNLLRERANRLEITNEEYERFAVHPDLRKTPALRMDLLQKKTG